MRRQSRQQILPLLLLICLATPASRRVNLVTRGSLEDPRVSPSIPSDPSEILGHQISSKNGSQVPTRAGGMSSSSEPEHPIRRAGVPTTGGCVARLACRGSGESAPVPGISSDVARSRSVSVGRGRGTLGRSGELGRQRHAPSRWR